jgi:hypothetical protein
MQSVPITTNVVILNPTHGEVYSIQHYVIKATGWLFPIPVSSINKSDHHDITEILLQMALNTLTLTSLLTTNDIQDNNNNNPVTCENMFLV